MTDPLSLPSPLERSSRGGPLLKHISVSAEVVTPILGGSSETRAIDDIDVIRAATVRGHLRFWWRALYAAQYATAGKLYERESEIWGRAASQEGGRSAVEIRIDIEKEGAVDTTDIRLNDSRDGKATPGAYALWPAREERNKGTPPEPRRMPGTRFRLALIVPTGFETEVANALRAWILFGGYGGRTRRGLGSLRVLDDVGAWLPQDASRDAFTHLFGFDLFAAPTKTPGDVPWLGGAALHVGKAQRSAMQAWTTALDWLREFRQGTSGPQGNRARESGTGKPQPNRRSISNWPEADKIRHLRRKTKAHPPRHNAAVVWPRAGFGLPIIGRFQTKGRDGSYLDEPGEFEIAWRSPKKGGQSGFDEHDRLASPLIVKALPFADGTFVPCALWLNRAYPVGEVILRGVAHSQAPFDRLVAPEDNPQFSALANKQSLRQAFLDWLHAKHRTTVVAP
ncbi:MAG TPA: type III-B CRISPR module RAMP protein Cmr1 [Polyangiaceae bacterium]|nr:type III-B CRISPR module RAMP protein Cmr1 [Polyangiaceae bacterium]